MDEGSINSLEQTAAGFHDGVATNRSRPECVRENSAGMMLSRTASERRPSDSSLHTLKLMENISDEEESNCPREESSSSSSSGRSTEGLSKMERRASFGSFIGGLLNQRNSAVFDTKTGQMLPQFQTSILGTQSDSSCNSSSIFSSSEAPTSSDNDSVIQRRRAASAHIVPSHQDAKRPGLTRVDSSEDLVRPYHNAYLKRFSFTAKPAIDAAIASSDKLSQSSSKSGSKSSSIGSNKKRRKVCSIKSLIIMVLFVASLVVSILALKGDIPLPPSVPHAEESSSGHSRSVADTWSNLLPGYDLSKLASITAVSPMEKLAKERMKTCIVNGKFEAEPDPTSLGYNVQSDISVTDSYSTEGSHSLLAHDRTNPRIGGVWQNINSDCLVPGAWYEVQANVILRNSVTQETVDCDPTIPWYDNEESCPSVAVKYDGIARDVAYTIGPLDHDPSSSMPGWHKLYGVFQPTEEMLKDPVLQVYVARAPVDVDIIIDSISINPATAKSVGIPDGNCKSNLVVNGDAETGDYRNWWIRGNGGDSGTIEMVPNAGKGSFSFKHSGYRSERWRGMLQMLDSTCLKADTTWIITASFRYFTSNDVGIEYPAVCDKSNPMVEGSCPVFELQFFSPSAGRMVINTGPLFNLDLADFKEGEWNGIYHRIVISPEMAAQTHAWLYVNSVDAGMNYELDDIRMIPLDS